MMGSLIYRCKTTNEMMPLGQRATCGSTIEAHPPFGGEFTGQRMSQFAQLYEDDVVAWAEQQAQALRDAARSNSNLPLDWENLAEEIEDLAKIYRSSLRSHLRRIIQHLVKLQHSPAPDPRRGWRQTVSLARSEVKDLLDESPSLKRQIEPLVNKVMESAIALALSDMEHYGEVNLSMSRLIRRRRYTTEQVLGEWFPPDPEPPARGE